MLGSVYCTFKKEIKSFEKYEMRTKIAGWDEKWLYILTFFLRFPKRKGEPKVLLAVGVSKYVVKKGRKTVRPENVLRASGLLPPRPPGEEVPSPPTALDTPANGEAIESGESLDEPLLRKVLTLTENSDLDKAVLDNDVKKNRDNTEKSGAWDWHRIEEERLRGMDVVRSFVNIDAKLHEEVDLSEA
ncbi:HotDog domain [Trichophyton rubrum]|nr:HotDog domain [Trichophyton rubrum]